MAALETSRYKWKIVHGSLGQALSARSEALLDAFAITPDVPLLKQLPPVELLKDALRAADRILVSLEAGEKVTIFGDYDVDGTTSCAMLRSFFAQCGFNADVYIPERLKEGYGLNPIGVTKLAEAGTKLIVTVDNGISAVHACEVAAQLGVDVIITDHHDLPSTLPTCFATLNPKQSDCLFPFKMLAGVGVAFYLMIAIRQRMREKNYSPDRIPNLRSFLDYVAIGTIADLAPLDGVNHIFCKIGLQVLQENIARGTRPGIEALLKCAGWSQDNAITASDVGFKIGPRLNACGRLGNALATEEVLETTNVGRAHELATFLDGENRERRSVEDQIKSEAFAQIEALAALPPFIIVYAPHWHTGVVGIVASRIVEKFFRPTIVLGSLDGKAKGSGRSVPGFDLFGAMTDLREHFASFGGHAMAVGVSLPEEKISWLHDVLSSRYAEKHQEIGNVPELKIQASVMAGDLSSPGILQWRRFEPFGMANGSPKWLLSNVKIARIKRIGKDASANHAQAVLADASGELECVAFSWAPVLEENLSQHVHAVVETSFEEWRGRMRVKHRLVDLVPSVAAERADSTDLHGF